MQYTEQKREGRPAFIFKAPKTKNSKRHIYIGPETLQCLRNQLQAVELLKRSRGAAWREYDLVFPSNVGTPMEPSNLTERFKAILAELNLPKIRFHDLRHTNATLLLLHGVHPKIVAERLGDSVKTILVIYSHVIPTLLTLAAGEIEHLLNEKTPESGSLKSDINLFERDIAS